MNLSYQHIAISGGVAVGNTTLLTNLKPFLEKEGFQFFSGGEYARQLAVELHKIDESKKIHHNAAEYDDSVDKQIDGEILQKLSSDDHWVIDSSLAGFLSRDMKRVLKILLICSNEHMLLDRLMNRDDLSANEAKANLEERERKNVEKWKRMYGDYDFFSPDYFDLVIDTAKIGPMETVGKVLDVLSSLVA